LRGGWLFRLKSIRPLLIQPIRPRIQAQGATMSDAITSTVKVRSRPGAAKSFAMWSPSAIPMIVMTAKR